jgi:membrane protein required for colicin V production
MNSFDIAVYLALMFAVVTGFNTGLLRGAIKILGYLIALPIAMTATSLLAPQLNSTRVSVRPWRRMRSCSSRYS